MGFYGAALPGSGDAYGAGMMDQNDLEHCVRLEHEINAGAGAIEAEEAAGSPTAGPRSKA